jgi:nucleoid-associated protein YgaU
VQRALIIGGIGVAFLGAAHILTSVDRADPPDVLSLTTPIQTNTATANLQLKPDPLRHGAPAMPPSLETAPQIPAASRLPVSPMPTVPMPTVPMPTFDVVRVNPQGNAVIAGRAEPHALVTVLDGGRPIGRTTADQRGEWVLLPEDSLAPGGRQLSLSSKRTDADEAVQSRDVVVLVVPEPAKDVAGQPASDRSGALALAVPRDGSTDGGNAPALLQAPPAAGKRIASSGNAIPALGAAPLPPGGVTVDVVDYGADGRAGIGGRAPPNARIQVYLDNVLIGHAVSGEDGRWGLTPDQPVRPGRYTLRADHVLGGGRVSARAEIPFQMADQAAQNLPVGQNIVVQPGASLWRIARRTYGDGVRFSVIYEANQSQIRDPDLIYPGQIFTVPQVN